MPEKKKVPWWADPAWWRKNWKAALSTAILVIGVIVALVVRGVTLEDHSNTLGQHETAIDTLAKKHMVLNQSFTSYRETVDEELEEIAEDIEGIAEEQSEAHDILIRIDERLGGG